MTDDKKKQVEEIRGWWGKKWGVYSIPDVYEATKTILEVVDALEDK